jgi:UPF0755 protein
MPKAKSKTLKRFLIIALILCAAGGATVLYLYKTPALRIGSAQYVKLNDGDGLEDLINKLEAECGLKYPAAFRVVAKRMNLERWMKRGRYSVNANMTIVDVVRIFRAGKMQTVDLVIRPLGTLEAFAEKCGEKLEPDAQDYMFLLNDSAFLDSMGFTRQTVYALLIPDTYNVYWHTQADELLKKLHKEYLIYWNDGRKQKAADCGLTPVEVATLASIVDKETNKKDEMPMVAGMYLNRLRIGMRLQADPTVKFALNQPGLRRILNGHLLVQSPYNTYMNEGLPPGPIGIPSKQAMQAILDHADHNYLFMCAKEDFSGYHAFAIDYKTHQLNARRYQAALDRRNIH